MATKPRHRKTEMQLWVADNRKAGGYTSADLAEWTGVIESTARGWESRGRPSEDAIRILERKFGKPAPNNGDASGDQTDLASAIRELVELLRPLVESQGQRIADLELVVQALVEPRLQDDPTPVAQPETRE